MGRERKGRPLIVGRQMVARKVTDYLHHRLTLPELVDWAEWAMMEAEFDGRDLDLIRDTVARLGLADVRAFGLTWEDCENLLSRLGYKAKVTVSRAVATV